MHELCTLHKPHKLETGLLKLEPWQEKIEKEKAKTQEVTDTYKKQIEESEAKHATEVCNTFWSLQFVRCKVVASQFSGFSGLLLVHE